MEQDSLLKEKRVSFENTSLSRKHEARAIRTPNRLIWSQTRYRCAIAPLGVKETVLTTYCFCRMHIHTSFGNLTTQIATFVD
jgi:hypothetical protein